MNTTSNLTWAPDITSEPIHPSTEITIVSPIPKTNFTPNASVTSVPIVKTTIAEDQAWNYAVPYLANHGLTNIQPNEVTSNGPVEINYVAVPHELVYSFIIQRCDAKYGNLPNVTQGGVIFIDAYDGHVVEYSDIC